MSTELKTQREADKVDWEIFDLKNKISKLKKPLDKYYEEKHLLEAKEKWEGKTFHNPKGSGFIYVVEVTKYGLNCTVVDSTYAGLVDRNQNFSGVPLNQFQIVMNVGYTHEDMRMNNCSEWRGIGATSIKRIEEKVAILKTQLLDNNKSV